MEERITTQHILDAIKCLDDAPLPQDIAAWEFNKEGELVRVLNMKEWLETKRSVES